PLGCHSPPRDAVRLVLIRVPPVLHRMPSFAHFDDRTPRSRPVCLSAYIISEDGEGLLVGRRAADPRWEGLDHPHPVDPKVGANLWVLPATHLLVGETPEQAARRIAKDQLAAPWLQLADGGTFAHLRPSAEGDPHWELAFVFETDLTVSKVPPWFTDLRGVQRRYLRYEVFAPGHGDIIADMGYLPPRSK
ncbi:MAG: NUDIX domain-containing protein, partial [Actinomycetota bacterium]